MTLNKKFLDIFIWSNFQFISIDKELRENKANLAFIHVVIGWKIQSMPSSIRHIYVVNADDIPWLHLIVLCKQQIYNNHTLWKEGGDRCTDPETGCGFPSTGLKVVLPKGTARWFWNSIGRISAAAIRPLVYLGEGPQD